jgi:hypothetical protein
MPGRLSALVKNLWISGNSKLEFLGKNKGVEYECGG